MFADDLVVIGGGRLLAAESVAAITAANEVMVIVETPKPQTCCSFWPAKVFRPKRSAASS